MHVIVLMQISENAISSQTFTLSFLQMYCFKVYLTK